MKDADIHETLSAHPFEATLERLAAAIAQAGPMPPATVLTHRHPKRGMPILLAAVAP